MSHWTETRLAGRGAQLQFPRGKCPLRGSRVRLGGDSSMTYWATRAEPALCLSISGAMAGSDAGPSSKQNE